MEQFASEIERYGLWVVFVNVLLAESGLPLPAFPILVVAGALAVLVLFVIIWRRKRKSIE